MVAKNKKRLAVLVSGGGSNMQVILDKIDSGEINGEIVLVVSSNAEAYALTRAKQRNIANFVCALKCYDSREQRDMAILKLLKSCNADYVLLAGYLGIITPIILQQYANKIINIHPALLPSYGGANYHGINVHRAVIAAKEPFSGATVHFVDEGTDTGLIIAQKRVAVSTDDTAETLQEKVLKNAEHILFPQVIKDLCDDRILIIENKVIYN